MVTLFDGVQQLTCGRVVSDDSAPPTTVWIRRQVAAVATSARNNDPFGLVGTSFDAHYEIQRVVGEGSFGVVYAALHRELRKHRAIKVLKVEHVREPKVVIERFWREARASTELKHAGAVEVYDARIAQPGGQLYYAMELLNGVSLHTRWLSCPQQRMPPVEALGIIRQVAAHLAVAHAAGIVHRDLKPENIFLCRDHSIKLLDFGCALMKEEPRLTTPGVLLGLPHYRAPDQLDLYRRSPSDARADIYALGVTLYHLLGGKLVYSGDHPAIVAKNIHLGPPTDIVEVAPDLPPSLHALIRRAMARNPEDRYQSMGELEEAIGKLLRGGELSMRVGVDASTLARTIERPRTLIRRLLSHSRPVAHAERTTVGGRSAKVAAPEAAQPQRVDEVQARRARPLLQPPVAAASPVAPLPIKQGAQRRLSRTATVVAAATVAVGCAGWLLHRGLSNPAPSGAAASTAARSPAAETSPPPAERSTCRSQKPESLIVREEQPSRPPTRAPGPTPSRMLKKSGQMIDSEAVSG
jgi:serine/threonine-protein kinase